MTYAIPKIIHQTYHSSPWPKPIEDNIARLKALNPEWEYRFYNDEEVSKYILTKYGRDMLDTFESIMPEYGAARADLFRYLLLYEEGGVYLDIKSSVRRPLDQIVRSDDTYLISRWDNGKGGVYEGWGRHPELGEFGSELQQWHIICAPRHPFLKAVLDRVTNNIKRYNPFVHTVGQRATLMVTGPIAYTLAIAPLLRDVPYREIDHEAEGLVYSVFGDTSDRPHENAMRSHYTKLYTIPLIRTNRALMTSFRLHRKVGGFLSSLRRRT